VREEEFRRLFQQFLYEYWGAFHEAVESESVTPERLAGSLFQAIRRAHEEFALRYTGKASASVETLGRLWEQLDLHRSYLADPPITAEDIGRARRQFLLVYHDLRDQGRAFPKVVNEILTGSPHETPAGPWHVDAAR